MVCDDYVNEELAKLLKKKGFDQNCPEYFVGGHRFRHCYQEVLPRNKETYAAPTLAVAAKWIREEHNIWLIVVKDVDYGWKYKPQSMVVSNEHKFDGTPYTGYYNTYEEALESAIKYCLENLV